MAIDGDGSLSRLRACNINTQTQAPQVGGSSFSAGLEPGYLKGVREKQGTDNNT